MPVIKNARHEKFAQTRFEGKTADESYAAAGFKPHRGNASRLSANESIVTRVTRTVLEHIQRANIYTQRTGLPLTIRAVFGLEIAGAGSTHRLAAYRRSPDVVKIHIPMPLRWLQAEQRLLKFGLYFEPYRNPSRQVVGLLIETREVPVDPCINHRSQLGGERENLIQSSLCFPWGRAQSADLTIYIWCEPERPE